MVTLPPAMTRPRTISLQRPRRPLRRRLRITGLDTYEKNLVSYRSRGVV